jgi:DNA-binding CsgD family transcriptional regulator
MQDYLSKQDLVDILTLINKSLSCADEECLRELILGLHCLIHFDFAICGLAEKNEEGALESYDVLNISYPHQWLGLYIAREYHRVDPIVKRNFSDYGLQHWRETYRLCRPPKGFLNAAEDFGLKEGYTMGGRNLMGDQGSLFSFSGASVECHPRTDTVLRHVVPHFHQALARVLGGKGRKRGRNPLSTRETEVLRWLRSGKSSWDISAILGISERTVNFHVRNIMHKLDVVNRPQAVAVALEKGLIELG